MVTLFRKNVALQKSFPQMDFTQLSRIALFRGVEVETLEAIFSDLKIREVSFAKGDILALQDEPVNRLIILLQGSVKAEMTDSSGRMVKVEDIQAPNPLAILFLFGHENRFPVQATAREEVRAVVIPKQVILRLLSMNMNVLENYLDLSADFATRLSRKLHFMSFRTIRQKMALYLLELAKNDGTDTVRLDKSKAALAQYFGISRPALEREITRMQQEGLLEADGRTFRWSDRQRLAALLRE